MKHEHKEGLAYVLYTATHTLTTIAVIELE